MASFQIAPLQRFTANKTSIKKPTEVAYFSYDNDHVLHPFSDISLRYYYPPFFKLNPSDQPEPIDLSKGFDTFRSRSDSPDEHLDGLLDTLTEAEKRAGKKLDADLITWRGMMTKILTAPFDNMDGFEMNATRFQDTIFVEENHGAKILAKAKQNTLQRHFQHNAPPPDLATFWGYKFETLCLMPRPWEDTSREEIEGRENEVVDNYAQYCSIARTGIGSTSLIIGGEVDGVLGYKPGHPDEPARWIELKTARPPEGDRDRDILNYERKLMKFWAQSFLLGHVLFLAYLPPFTVSIFHVHFALTSYRVPKIIVGFRDRAGFLTNIQELDTQKIPGIVQHQGRRSWDANTCVRFAGAFLDFLKATITEDGVWRIRREAKSNAIEVSKVIDAGTGEVLKREFVEWRTQLAAKARAAEADGQSTA